MSLHPAQIIGVWPVSIDWTSWGYDGGVRTSSWASRGASCCSNLCVRAILLANVHNENCCQTPHGGVLAGVKQGLRMADGGETAAAAETAVNTKKEERRRILASPKYNRMGFKAEVRW
jgi:hypothetical protein